MKTTITIVRTIKGVKSIEKVEYATKAVAKVMAATFNKENGYFIDDNNEAYAYV